MQGGPTDGARERVPGLVNRGSTPGPPIGPLNWLFKAGKNRSLENIIDNSHVRVYGNTAVVEARERVRFRDDTGEHWLTWHITDVFVQQVGQWQVVTSHGSTIPNH